MATSTASFQQVVAGSGALPIVEGLMLARLMRLCLPGLGDVQYAQGDAELSGYLLEKHRGREGASPGLDAPSP